MGLQRAYTWVILSCMHWYKRESAAGTVPPTLRCPTCGEVAEVLDTCPVRESPSGWER